MPTQCACKGCQRVDARWYPQLITPAFGYPIDRGAIPIVFALAHCDAHRKTATVTDFMNDEAGKLKAIISAAVRARGSIVPPDFTRTALHWLDEAHSDVRRLFRSRH